ncbi:unnamed protein product [Caenorhabditis auriculariae]|uniref:DIS3-like exonuclease 2 n=1 Tax=Caenorhabditis auriculariae TaxID=2777116 RepID=A0A8S1GVB5_9PELO|nr:unnamed protein product [Caenorhabditis auriculariae]
MDVEIALATEKPQASKADDLAESSEDKKTDKTSTKKKRSRKGKRKTPAIAAIVLTENEQSANIQRESDNKTPEKTININESKLDQIVPTEFLKNKQPFMSPHTKYQGQQRFLSTPQKNFQSCANGDAGPEKKSTTLRKKIFADYISEAEVSDGLAKNLLIEGVIRINPRNYQECYLNNPLGSAHNDILILGRDRNRAMNNDVVVVRVKPQSEWIVIPNEYEAWVAKETEKCGKIAEPPKEELKTGAEGDCTILDKLLDEIDLNLANPATPKTEVRYNKNVGSVSRDTKNQKKTLKDAIFEMDKNICCLVPPECLQITAEVVYIKEKKHPRLAAGKLQPLPNSDSKEFAYFVPNDGRVPRILIPHVEVDKEFFTRPKDFAKFIYMANIKEWYSDSIYAIGSLEKNLGERGEIEAETEAILQSNEIDTREFSEETLACLPITSADQWSIPEKEFEYRRDFREEIVFTIDPKTARDLDDALSIKPLDDIDGRGTPGWEIGVHIADVTFFVEDTSVLDQWAQSRANSTYLVTSVIPMLPRILSEQLCSLNPGVDRLTFSVVWKMNDKAEIVDEWFGRTVIRSRVKLSYEHAQDFIDNPEKDFEEEELPPISDGTSVFHIKEKVLQLNRVAQVLRRNRETNGALRIEQPKLKFSIDPVTKQPLGVSVYKIQGSNKLVEEYMLLANMSVAKFIGTKFPQTAMLRRHPPPKEKMMREVLETCARIGFPLDGNSSAELSTSLRKFQNNSLLHTCIRQVLSSITIKPMQMALYFCISSVESPSDYRHYALNVPFYTHFTSPIRRYPDMVVHRQLAMALGYGTAIDRTPDELDSIAKHCNERKLASKTASEQSDEVFFGLFVNVCGRINSKGVVLQVLDRAFSVLVVQYGVVKRVYCDKLKIAADQYNRRDGTLTLTWGFDPDAEEGNREPFKQVIQVCTVLDVELYPLDKDDKCQYGARIHRPTKRDVVEKTLSRMFEKDEEIAEVNELAEIPAEERAG